MNLFKKPMDHLPILRLQTHSLSLIRDKFGTRKGIVGYNPGGEGHPAFWAMATDSICIRYCRS